MIRQILSLGLFVILVSCNDGSEGSTEASDSNAAGTPTAIDTTQHPTGITTGSVISTDTAAMRVPPAPDSTK